MGRNSKPVALHIAEGNPNRLTKEQIAARKDGEVKLGGKLSKHELEKLRKPTFVSKDRVANKLWNDLIKEYVSAAEQGVELLTSSDVGMLAMYCKTYSEYERLLIQYQRLENVKIDEHILDEYIGRAKDVDEVNYKALRYLSQLASIEGILKIETAINKKMDMLLKMQDRLFLNPLAKVKNVPKPKKEEKPVSKFGKFGGGRGG
ncbi:P27 family phage terminase small subunit [Cohnella luojiensis]|uniref:Terminase n=1 Tax=Cohnella luojiensis TaxID=652876 RepID=A0A4Y8M579_9BACL|nr:P27 family phage terminase small subunit [Cohnella luojiensis]TFE30826.1 terminase [Cohnella luojiensis]